VSHKLGLQGVISHKNIRSFYLTQQFFFTLYTKNTAFEQIIFTNSILKYSALFK